MHSDISQHSPALPRVWLAKGYHYDFAVSISILKAHQRCENLPASSTRFRTCLFPFVPVPEAMPLPERGFTADGGPADGSSLSAGPAAGCGSAEASLGASAMPCCSPTPLSASAAEAALSSASLACTAHTCEVPGRIAFLLRRELLLLCVVISCLT